MSSANLKTAALLTALALILVGCGSKNAPTTVAQATTTTVKTTTVKVRDCATISPDSTWSTTPPAGMKTDGTTPPQGIYLFDTKYPAYLTITCEKADASGKLANGNALTDLPASIASTINALNTPASPGTLTNVGTDPLVIGGQHTNPSAILLSSTAIWTYAWADAYVNNNTGCAFMYTVTKGTRPSISRIDQVRALATTVTCG